MKKIPLTRGEFALVDDDDYEWLMQWEWQCWESKDSKCKYAMREIYENGKHTSRKMHSEIMGLPKGTKADHKDRNGLNNQRHNLRRCTNSQNGHNASTYSTNTSGYKGVSFVEKLGKWRARIMLNDKSIHVGYFKTKKEAALARDAVAKERLGAFAWLNFPNE